jgi:hypothetical protein
MITATHSAQSQESLQDLSFGTVRDESVRIFVELAKQLPQTLPSDFPYTDNSQQANDYGYNQFELDQDELSKELHAPIVQSFLLSPLPQLPDEIHQQLAQSPMETGISQVEQKKRIQIQKKIFHNYFEAPGFANFKHEHWVGLPTAKKIGVYHHAQEVWNYPNGTRLLHIMRILPPVNSFTIGSTEAAQEIFSTYPDNMIVPFELRLLQKTESGMWAVGVYRPKEIKHSSETSEKEKPPIWQWLRVEDLDSDEPRTSMWGKVGQQLPTYKLTFGANTQTSPPLTERSISGELHSANPLSCLSCHLSSSRSQHQFPGLRLIDKQNQPVALDDKIARIFILPYCAPNSFAPANSAIRDDENLAELFEEKEVKEIPAEWPAGTKTFERSFIPYVVTKILDR